MSAGQILASILIPVGAAIVIGLGRWGVGVIGRELRRLIRETVEPSINSIHERIDKHMDEEEASLLVLAEVLAELGGLDVDVVRGRIERRADRSS